MRLFILDEMPVSARQPRRLSPALVLAAVAAAAYLNTLPAQFTFDDSFAVVRPPGSCYCCRAERSRAAGPSAWGAAGAHPICWRATPTAPALPVLQVYNGDVTDLNKPLLAVFRNDFWCGTAPFNAACWVCRAPTCSLMGRP